MTPADDPFDHPEVRATQRVAYEMISAALHDDAEIVSHLVSQLDDQEVRRLSMALAGFVVFLMNDMADMRDADVIRTWQETCLHAAQNSY
jgi:hypothetical protein